MTCGRESIKTWAVGLLTAANLALGVSAASAADVEVAPEAPKPFTFSTTEIQF